ncbi:MAG TPA: PDZ domain-containing protein, partial [Spirochaetales bacterium]|nr:PDZ domain-containing protein [Spirochaetales bacterium]
MNKLESKAELFKKKALVPFIGSFMVLALVLTFTLVAIPPVNAQDQNVQEYLSLLQSVYLYVLQNYVDEVDPQVLYEGAMKGLFEALNDPYSVFLDEQMLNDLNDTTSGKFGGIGLYISKPLPANLPAGKKAWVEVVSPIEDTPGWKAGIQPGDYITHIDGESTEEMTMEQVLSKLRGEPNTKVTITIQRG